MPNTAPKQPEDPNITFIRTQGYDYALSKMAHIKTFHLTENTLTIGATEELDRIGNISRAEPITITVNPDDTVDCTNPAFTLRNSNQGRYNPITNAQKEAQSLAAYHIRDALRISTTPGHQRTPRIKSYYNKKHIERAITKAAAAVVANTTGFGHAHDPSPIIHKALFRLIGNENARHTLRIAGNTATFDTHNLVITYRTTLDQAYELNPNAAILWLSNPHFASRIHLEAGITHQEIIGQVRDFIGGPDQWHAFCQFSPQLLRHLATNSKGAYDYQSLANFCALAGTVPSYTVAAKVLRNLPQVRHDYIDQSLADLKQPEYHPGQPCSISPDSQNCNIQVLAHLNIHREAFILSRSQPTRHGLTQKILAHQLPRISQSILSDIPNHQHTPLQIQELTDLGLLTPLDQPPQTNWGKLTEHVLSKRNWALKDYAQPAKKKRPTRSTPPRRRDIIAVAQEHCAELLSALQVNISFTDNQDQVTLQVDDKAVIDLHRSQSGMITDHADCQQNNYLPSPDLSATDNVNINPLDWSPHGAINHALTLAIAPILRANWPVFEADGLTVRPPDDDRVARATPSLAQFLPPNLQELAAQEHLPLRLHTAVSRLLQPDIYRLVQTAIGHHVTIGRYNAALRRPDTLAHVCEATPFVATVWFQIHADVQDPELPIHASQMVAHVKHTLSQDGFDMRLWRRAARLTPSSIAPIYREAEANATIGCMVTAAVICGNTQHLSILSRAARKIRTHLSYREQGSPADHVLILFAQELAKLGPEHYPEAQTLLDQLSTAMAHINDSYIQQPAPPKTWKRLIRHVREQIREQARNEHFPHWRTILDDNQQHYLAWVPILSKTEIDQVKVRELSNQWQMHQETLDIANSTTDFSHVPPQHKLRSFHTQEPDGTPATVLLARTGENWTCFKIIGANNSLPTHRLQRAAHQLAYIYTKEWNRTPSDTREKITSIIPTIAQTTEPPPKRHPDLMKELPF